MKSVNYSKCSVKNQNYNYYFKVFFEISRKLTSNCSNCKSLNKNISISRFLQLPDGIPWYTVSILWALRVFLLEPLSVSFFVISTLMHSHKHTKSTISTYFHMRIFFGKFVLFLKVRINSIDFRIRAMKWNISSIKIIKFTHFISVWMSSQFSSIWFFRKTDQSDKRPEEGTDVLNIHLKDSS